MQDESRMEPFSQAKAVSLLYSIHEQFEHLGDWEAPEPNFWKWFEKVGFADTGECHDNVLWDKLDDSERRAWQLFADAIQATASLLEFRHEHSELFQKVARRLSFLPTFLSWHPDCERFNRQLLAESELGTRGIHSELRRHPHHLRYQPWPTRYAYAIVAVIELNLDTYGDRLPWMAELYGYGQQHPLRAEETEEALAKLRCSEKRLAEIREEYRGAYRILPGWAKHLRALKQRFCKATALDYWRTGKAMLREEMPGFHERPEWSSYHTRHYSSGATPGAVQHAIFRDILDALRTIAPDEPTADTADV
jgi:hypothetical protein